MKKEKSIQADIEVLKRMVTDWMEAKQSRQNALAEIDPVLGGTEIVLYEIEIERDERNIKTLQRTISALEAMRDKPEMKSAGRTVCKKCNEIFQPILNKALEENKELRKRLDDWIYELAYYTEDEVATPKGVKKFIGKAIEDKVKEIKELREEIKDRAGTEKSLTAWVNELGEENDSLKLAQPNALKASEVKPKPLSKQRIEEIVSKICLFEYQGATNDADNGRPVTIDDYYPKGFSKHIAEAIYNASNAQSEEKYCNCKKPKITLGQHTLRDYCDKCNKPIIQNKEDNK